MSSMQDQRINAAQPAEPGQPQASAAEKYYNKPRLEIESLLPVSAVKALELGCVAGTTMAWIKSRIHISHAEGIELVPEIAEKARTVFNVVHVCDLDSFECELTQHDFDLVLALDVLEHLREPWALLRRISEHMHPTGAIIASIPNIAHYSIAFPLLLRGTFDYAKWGILDRTHLRFFTRESALKMFQDCNYVVDRCESNRVYPNPLNSIGLRGRRCTWYNKRIMDCILPQRLLDYQFLIKARPIPCK